MALERIVDHLKMRNHGQEIRPEGTERSETGDARTQAWPVEKREVRQARQEPKTGDRDWTV